MAPEQALLLSSPALSSRTEFVPLTLIHLIHTECVCIEERVFKEVIKSNGGQQDEP